jgi:hypothetical protein
MSDVLSETIHIPENYVTSTVRKSVDAGNTIDMLKNQIKTNKSALKAMVTVSLKSLTVSGRVEPGNATKISRYLTSALDAVVEGSFNALLPSFYDLVQSLFTKSSEEINYDNIVSKDPRIFYATKLPCPGCKKLTVVPLLPNGQQFPCPRCQTPFQSVTFAMLLDKENPVGDLLASGKEETTKKAITDLF